MPRRTSPLKLEPKGDVKQLKKLLKESPVVMLVVFANWCGHCQTMKKNVWDPMCKRQKVNANNVAAVESSVLESAGEEGKEILKNVSGFPSVLEVVNGKIKKSIPPPQTVKEFEELVNNAEKKSMMMGSPGSTPFPKQTSAAAASANDKMYNEIEPSSTSITEDTDLYNQTEPLFTPEQPEKASSSLFTRQSRQYTPEVDILNQYDQEQQQEQKPLTGGGGNLYNTLRNINSGILPAGILGMTRLALRGGRRRLSKKTRKVKQKKHRKYTRKH